MKIRGRIALVAAYVVAIVVAIAMPVSQLRTVETIVEKCCCPDPNNCHCPHTKDPSQKPQMRSCHRVAHDIVAPQLPSFAPPEVALAQPEARVIELPVIALVAPHPAPASRRPDAPS